ncbi:hypothetical protein JCM10213_003975 [Rhodosporidiobolus nylandii]
MAVPLDVAHTATASWGLAEATPTASAAPSAAVSRSPTLVDVPALGLEAALADEEGKGGAKAAHSDGGEHHHHHLSHPHLPPAPHQHLEQFYPPENWESPGEVEQEKAAARRAAEEGGSDPEKGGKGQPAAGQDDYPDGGLRAWLVVAGAWAVSFTAWGYPNSFGVLLSYTHEHQLANYDTSAISWIGAFQLFANLFFGLLSGKAFDAGYCTWLLVAGLVFYTAGLFGLANSSSYSTIFVTQGLLCGIASGLMFLPACSAVSHWWKRKRMLALGFLATGSSLGGVMYPALTNHLLHTISFEWTFRILGFINLGLIAFACIVIRPRLPPRTGGKIVDFTVFKGDLGFTLYVTGAAIVWLGLYTPLFFSESYALEKGVSENIAFYSLSILNAASLFGRTIPNYMADRFGPLTILVPMTSVSGILLFCWIPAMKTEAGVIVWSLFYGFFQGSFVSMLPASVAALTDDMTTVGIRMAMSFLIQSITALTGTPIAGYIISLHPEQPGYTGAAIYSGLVVLLGVSLIGVARHLVSKRRGTPWV